MNVERAIEALEMENALMQFDPNTGEDYPIELQNQDNQDLYNANLVAIEALEKQSPKKTKGNRIIICQICKNAYIDYLQKYCQDCGQKLDWSEVE